MSRFAVPRVAWIALTIGLLAAAGGALVTRRVDEVGRALGAPLPRRIAPRTSVATEFRECTTPDVVRDSQPTTCATQTGDAAARRRGAAAMARGDTTAVGHHARALVELLWGGTSGNAVDTSIHLLERLAEARPSAAVLTDLSAAHLVRWERRRSARDLLAAVDAADRAIALDAQAVAARFDLALALQHLGLDRMAAIAWRQYLAREPESSWRREAVRRAAALARDERAPPSASDSVESIRRWASTHRQRARELAMDEWLPEWGGALIRRDSVAASKTLAAVRALAVGMEAGDATARVAVASIDAAAPAERFRLARAHVTYGESQRRFLRSTYDSAASGFDAIRTDESLPQYLRHWASSGRAATAVNANEPARADTLLRRLLAAADAGPLHSARGRANWALGLIAARDARFGDALARFDSARAEYARAREEGNEATTHLLLGESQFRSGNTNVGLSELHTALRHLQPLEASIWLHNTLNILARFTEGEGFPRAARFIAEEDVRAAAQIDSTRYNRPMYVVEARIGLARIVSPDRDSVIAALADAPRLLPLVARANVRAVLEQQLAFALARGISQTDPRQAAAMLAAPVAFHRRNARGRLLPVLLLRADVRGRLGSTDSAAADLDEATQLLDANRAAVTSEWHRAAVVAQVRTILERLVLERANAKDASGSLAHLERGRRSLNRDTARIRVALAAGSVAITHALIGDTLLTWVVDEHGPSLRRAIIDRAELIDAVVTTRAALERRDDARAIPGLELLYERLVRPVAERLPAGATLVTAEDGALAGVPYAALRDRARSRWLVEDHAIVTALSVRDGARTMRRPSQPMRGGEALFVADAASNSEPRALADASREVAGISRRYRKARLLPAPTPRAFTRALAGASLVHFAGHAVSDPRRPERSHLLLPNDDSGDRLTAVDIERLDLSRVQLFVLAACESMAPEPGGSAYRGVGDALRAAGVGGVLGSLWRVDDRHTRELMERFHATLSATHDAMQALALAQRAMITSDDSRLASPSAWAGFQYSGQWAPSAVATIHNRER